MHGSMIPVLSSNIDGYRYLNDRQMLLIAFKGGSTYCYENVTNAVVSGFMNAPSKGVFFGKQIKDHFQTTKLDEMAVSNMLSGLEKVMQKPPLQRTPSLMLPKLLLKYPILSAMF